MDEERTGKKLPSIKVRPTALARPITLTLTYDLQSPAKYGHDLLTCKRSRSTVSQFRRQSENRRKDGQTDRDDYITALTNAVGNKTRPLARGVSALILIIGRQIIKNSIPLIPRSYLLRWSRTGRRIS